MYPGKKRKRPIKKGGTVTLEGARATPAPAPAAVVVNKELPSSLGDGWELLKPSSGGPQKKGVVTGRPKPHYQSDVVLPSGWSAPVLSSGFDGLASASAGLALASREQAKEAVQGG